MYIVIRRYTERMPFEVLPKLYPSQIDAETAIRRMMKYETTACSYWTAPLSTKREWLEII